MKKTIEKINETKSWLFEKVNKMNLVKLQDSKLIHRNLLHFHTLPMKDQKGKFRKQSHLPKEAKDLYSENYKMRMKEIEDDTNRASLLAQWLRICLPMQGTWVRALVWEDPTCCRVTKPLHHNY